MSCCRANDSVDETWASEIEPPVIVDPPTEASPGVGGIADGTVEECTPGYVRGRAGLAGVVRATDVDSEVF